MDGKEFRRSCLGMFGGILAALVVVKGIIALVPDFLLLDGYGDVRGVFQLALGVIALGVFSATWRALDGDD